MVIPINKGPALPEGDGRGRKCLASAMRRVSEESVIKFEWGCHAWLTNPRPSGNLAAMRAKHPWASILAVSVGVIAVFAGMAWIRSSAYGGLLPNAWRDPDPGGRILAQLQPAAAALPADANVIYRHDLKPHWSSCGGRPGTFGWSNVVLQVHFSTQTGANDLLRHARETLVSQGWDQHESPNHSPEFQQWTKRLENGTTAALTIDKDWYGHNVWTLLALAPPVGTASSGC